MKKIYSAVIIIVAIVGSLMINALLLVRPGERNYFSFPFPIKVTSCGSALGLVCDYPYVWWGIVLSIIFWALIIWVAYKVGKQKNVGMVSQ